MQNTISPSRFFDGHEQVGWWTKNPHNRTTRFRSDKGQAKALSEGHANDLSQNATKGLCD
jgi:hypothetical protein